MATSLRFGWKLNPLMRPSSVSKCRSRSSMARTFGGTTGAAAAPERGDDNGRSMGMAAFDLAHRQGHGSSRTVSNCTRGVGRICNHESTKFHIGARRIIHCASQKEMTLVKETYCRSRPRNNSGHLRTPEITGQVQLVASAKSNKRTVRLFTGVHRVRRSVAAMSRTLFLVVVGLVPPKNDANPRALLRTALAT